MGGVSFGIQYLTRIWVSPHIERFQSQTLTLVSSVLWEITKSVYGFVMGSTNSVHWILQDL